MTKKIMLHGAYNGSNFGDFILAWVIQKKIYEAGAETVLNNASPYFLKLMGKNDSLPLKADYKIVDAAVFGGGGYLATRRIGLRGIRLLLMTHLVPMIKMINQRKPFIICGTGVGPIHDPILRRIAVKTLEKASAIYVRNEESKKYLNNYGLNKYVEVTSDLALTFSVNDIPIEYINSAKKALERFEGKRVVFIHINLLNAFSKKKNKLEVGCDYLVKDIETFAMKHPEVAFVIGSDYESTKVDRMNEYIYNLLGKEKCVLLNEYNVWRLAGYLSVVDVILTTKLHVGIVGTSLGKTVISFSGDQKIHRFYKQIGKPERSIELKTVKDGDCLKQIEKYIDAEPVDISVQRRNAEITLQKTKEFVESVL
jgi:polysaccharide pyruvyl transferase WcaK-like protein